VTANTAIISFFMVSSVAVERELLSTLGDEQVTERVWVPGSSNEAELPSPVL
jgi:hypothetical protein